MRALPGVDGAGFVTTAPGQGYGVDEIFSIVGHPALPQGSGLAALSLWADPKYFGAMGIPIMRGRTFDSGKRLDAANEAIISQSFARQYFPNEDPLGKHLRVRGKDAVIALWVIPALPAKRRSRCNITHWMPPRERLLTLVIRSSYGPEQFALPVQRIVSDMDRDLPVSDVLTMNQLLGKSTLDQSFSTLRCSSLFATLSLVLAAAGLFGVMSYITAQRKTEIGIRIALGARREQVMRQMLLDGMGPAVVGLGGPRGKPEVGLPMRDCLRDQAARSRGFCSSCRNAARGGRVCMYRSRVAHRGSSDAGTESRVRPRGNRYVSVNSWSCYFGRIVIVASATQRKPM